MFVYIILMVIEMVKPITVKQIQYRINQTISNMEEMKNQINFEIKDKEKAIEKRKEALNYVMEELYLMDRLIRIGF